MTSPAVTVLLDCRVMVPTTKPTPVIAEVATACVSPMTFGTETCAGPLEITRLTAEPTLTLVPAAGFSLITLPAATVLLDRWVIVPTTKPALVMAEVAAAWVSPITFGTATCAGPVDITRLTAEPIFTLVPAVGFSLMTSPAATVLLDCWVMAPTTKPTPVMAEVATACVSPMRFGTDTCAGPVEITRFTAEPTLTLVPAAGFSLITSPEGTVLLDAVVTVPSSKPPPLSAVVAAACVSPTTFGTDTFAGPIENDQIDCRPDVDAGSRRWILADHVA